MKSDNFQFSSDEIATACLTWAHFNGFSGETCGACHKTANVLAGMPWVCKCGHDNAMDLNCSRPMHATPDLGPTLATIQAGYESAKARKGVPVAMTFYPPTKKESL